VKVRPGAAAAQSAERRAHQQFRTWPVRHTRHTLDSTHSDSLGISYYEYTSAEAQSPKGGPTRYVYRCPGRKHDIMVAEYSLGIECKVTGSRVGSEDVLVLLVLLIVLL